MKKHRLPYMVVGAVLFAALFTGCTNERLEDELDFRKIGINSMQSGDYEGAVAAFNSALSQCVGKIQIQNSTSAIIRRQHSMPVEI